MRATPLGDWLTPGRFALVLGLLIFASFPQVVLGLQTFVVRDFGFFAYPLAHFQREAHGAAPIGGDEEAGQQIRERVNHQRRSF